MTSLFQTPLQIIESAFVFKVKSTTIIFFFFCIYVFTCICLHTRKGWLNSMVEFVIRSLLLVICVWACVSVGYDYYKHECIDNESCGLVWKWLVFAIIIFLVGVIEFAGIGIAVAGFNEGVRRNQLAWRYNHEATRHWQYEEDQTVNSQTLNAAT